MIKCPFCHYDNEDGALFCEQCKSDLAGVAAVTPAMAEAAPAPGPVIAEAVPFEGGPLEAAPMEAVPLEAMPVAQPEEGPTALEAVALQTPPDTPAATPRAAEPPQAEEPAGPAPSTVPPTVVPAPAAPAAATLPQGAQPRLLVLRGLKRNVEYPIYDGLNFIGRADEKPVDIDLEDQEPPDRIWCSRQHACISFEADQMAIEDLNSANGTYVNRNRIYPGTKRPLAPNDIIQIGNVQLKVIV
jgi:hypothetical protein